MFYCPLHNWYSSEEPCKACFQTITTTLSTSAGTGPESKDVFTWDDYLEEFATEVLQKWHGDTHINEIINDFKSKHIYRPKQSKQPIKPDTKERIEVIDFEFDRYEKWIKLHFKNEFRLMLKDDYSKIKQAIEAVINNERLYRKFDVDTLMRDAFDAARDTVDGTYRYGHTFRTFNDYLDTINSLNTNQKQQPHE